MKAGARALGVAASDGDTRSVLAGALVRADRVLSDLVYETCTVGGLDATTAVADLFQKLGREDVRCLLLAGIAPAWFNLCDLTAIHDAVDRPVISVSFEASEGLEPALRREFDGDALETRLGVYEQQPPRQRITVHDRELWVRSVGYASDEAGDVVRALTPADAGGRPEPLRAARLAARAGRAFHERWDQEH